MKFHVVLEIIVLIITGLSFISTFTGLTNLLQKHNISISNARKVSFFIVSITALFMLVFAVPNWANIRSLITGHSASAGSGDSEAEKEKREQEAAAAAEKQRREQEAAERRDKKSNQTEYTEFYDRANCGNYIRGLRIDCDTDFAGDLVDNKNPDFYRAGSIDKCADMCRSRRDCKAFSMSDRPRSSCFLFKNWFSKRESSHMISGFK